MELQKTIKREARLQGIGLHTGKMAELTFKPASVDSGIVFVRVDLPDRPNITATASNIIDITKAPRRTSIGNGEVEVHTIEHLMASLSGLGIDNIIVEINAEEVPGLDGSATPFLEALREAHLIEQDRSKRLFHIREPIWVEDQGASLTILPSNDFDISYTLSYDHFLLRAQFLTFRMNDESFEREIASSRTFCLQEEAEELRKEGLGKGANYENTLVVGKTSVVDNNLRFEDEFVRHKVLDLIGDLYLLGCTLKGRVIAIKSGHPLNIKLLKKIAHQREHLQLGAVKAEYGEISGVPLNTADIMKILPHRHPFLLVDKIIGLEEGKRATGIKNVTINDGFFAGHFPGRPVMPGVLIIEAMAQVAGVLMLSRKENFGKLAFFMAMDNVKFRRTVVPGDQLVLEVEVGKLKSRTGQVHTKALVEGKVVAEADLMFSLVEA